MLLKPVVHLKILGKVIKSNYIAFIFFNMSAKIGKILNYIEIPRYIKFGYLRCSEKCQWILFYSEMSLKNVVHLRILGKVLKIAIWPLFFINGRAKFEKYLIIIEKKRHNKFGYFHHSKKCQLISVLLRSFIKGCSPSQNIRWGFKK